MPPLLLSRYRLPGGAYEGVFARGEVQVGGRLVLRWVANGLGMTRVGVVSAKRTFRRAVDRSRARRLLREAFRLERPGLRVGVDMVLVGRARLVEVGCGEVRKEFRRLCRRGGLWCGEAGR